MCARHRCLIRFALLLLLLIPPEVGRAQQDPSELYRGFQFDSLFRVGADDFSMTNMAWLKDSLRLDFIRMYGGPSRVTDTLLFTTDPDSADTAWILALNHQRTAWFNRLLLARWHELWQIDLKVVTPSIRLRNSSRGVAPSRDSTTTTPPTSTPRRSPGRSTPPTSRCCLTRSSRPSRPLRFHSPPVPRQ